MAAIKPFAALRPRPDLAPRICAPPYDVLSSDEARIMASGNPLSFLHVSKPEIDLPPDTDLYAPEVYAKAGENFARLIATGALRQDPSPAFYLYRQVMGTHRQVGWVAVASCEDYLRGVIKKHELTRPDKEADRLRHIETLNAQTGPAFLTYRAVLALTEIAARKTGERPDVDFTAEDGIRHTSWSIADAATIGRIQTEFQRIPALYIADGHHRSAAAARVCRQRRGAGGSAHFLAVIFPHDQLQILPYNRVLKDLNGLTPAQLLEKLSAFCEVRPDAPARPLKPHQLGLFLAGHWHLLEFREHFLRAGDPVGRLDVTLLQDLVLGPVFGIKDPRTSERISLVGGIRGTAELEQLVRSGEGACAFSLFPTRIEDLLAVADAGGLMPPKSTWFEPKLRDAMFCHLI
jgi:uncharacterized protein (DUF1015 family)